MQASTASTSNSPLLQTLSRASFWQQHVCQWRDSGLSKVAYSRQYALAYHQMVYWSSKADKSIEEPAAPAKGFVPVSITPSASNSGLSIQLPSGVCINGIDEQSIALVGRLIEQL